jgi:hypothetical protein
VRYRNDPSGALSTRNSVDQAKIEAFLAAGHTRRHVLDIEARPQADGRKPALISDAT